MLYVPAIAAFAAYWTKLIMAEAVLRIAMPSEAKYIDYRRRPLLTGRLGARREWESLFAITTLRK